MRGIVFSPHFKLFKEIIILLYIAIITISICMIEYVTHDQIAIYIIYMRENNYYEMYILYTVNF